MKVNEIFLSIQGESSSIGLPTVFVRFTGCNLRCSYCDTTYAYYDGHDMSLDDIMDEINTFGYKRVCLTGGEPLLQQDIHDLIDRLAGYDVSIETNGSVELNQFHLHPGQRFVMDVKLVSSGCYDDMKLSNFDYLSDHDEIKFVVCNRQDYELVKKVVSQYHRRGRLVISPVFGAIDYATIVEWILEDKLDVRFQLQIHKIIWDKNKRGV